MEALDAILTRRSVRRFTDQPITHDVMEKILKAGMSAPSAGNEQPWHYLVVTDLGLLSQIPMIHPYAKMCAQAKAAIVVCGDPSLEKYKGFWVQDVSASVQNMLIAIRALGLGAVWVGVYPDESKVQAVKELFKLPEEITPFCMVPVGYTDMKQEVSDRYQKERVHSNTW